MTVTVPPSAAPSLSPLLAPTPVPFCQASPRYVQPTSSYAIAHFSPQGRTDHRILFGFTLGWLVINLFIYAYGRRRFPERMAMRPPYLIIVFSLAMVSYILTDLTPAIGGAKYYPCACTTFFALMVVPLMGVVTFARDASVVLLTRFAQATLKYGKLAIKDLAVMSPDEMASKSIAWKLRVIGVTFLSLVKCSEHDERVEQDNRADLLRHLRFAITTEGAMMFLLIPLIPFVILDLAITLADPINTAGCTQCRRDTTSSYILFAQCVVWVAFYMVIVYNVRNLPDRWGLLQESRLAAIFSLLAVAGYTYTTFAPTSPTVSFDHMITTSGFCLSFATLSSFQVFLCWREEVRQRQLKDFIALRKQRQSQRLKEKAAIVRKPSKSPSGSTTEFASLFGSVFGEEMSVSNESTSCVQDLECDSLLAVMKRPTLAQEFDEYLASEFAIENLLFLKETWLWIESYPDDSKEDRFAKAKVLITNFVSLDGLMPVNLNHVMSERLLQFTQHLDADPPLNLFAEARHEIGRLLEFGPVMRFLIAKGVTADDLLQINKDDSRQLAV